MSEMQHKNDVLKVRSVYKAFPGVQALDNVDFTLQGGEIHAVVGQNGAGKSTLMKILAGSYQCDSGEIFINGKICEISNPRVAADLGVALVHQELSNAAFRTVAENIFLGREPVNRFGMVDRDQMNQNALELLYQLGEKNISPDKNIEYLSVAEQQIVEIVKALSLEPSILILDEPTSALTLKETERLFTILRALRDTGIGVIFITHRLKEIFQLCDRVTVMRDGKVVETLTINESDEQTVVTLMTGQNLDSFFTHDQATIDPTDVILEVEGLTLSGKLDDISFRLHRGEILGITGLLGSGHDLIPRCIFGIESLAPKVRCLGQDVQIKSSRDALQAGLGLVTENRKDEGLFLKMTVLKNMTLLVLRRVSQTLVRWIKRKKEVDLSAEYIELLNIATPSANALVQNLSGGNQQKVIIGRWLMKDPEILMFIEPTRGIDVGAKSEIYHYLHKIARESGKGIIVSSTELQEVLGISDRILAVYNGQIVDDIPRDTATEELVLTRINGR
jgi:ABC-type sugar transport system ATPase subunit